MVRCEVINIAEVLVTNRATFASLRHANPDIITRMYMFTLHVIIVVIFQGGFEGMLFKEIKLIVLNRIISFTK